MREKERQAHFMSLYEPLHSRFERFCRARTYSRDDAKDLASETILKAYEGFHKLRNDEAFLHYLFSIASRVLSRQYRWKKFWMKNARPSHEPVSADSTEVAVDIDILKQAIADLPSKYRDAVILFELSGFSMKEISIIEKCSLSAVKVRVMRAREKLKGALGVTKIESQEAESNEPFRP